MSCSHSRNAEATTMTLGSAFLYRMFHCMEADIASRELACIPAHIVRPSAVIDQNPHRRAQLLSLTRRPKINFNAFSDCSKTILPI